MDGAVEGEAPPVPSEVREHWRQHLESALDTPNTQSAQSGGPDAYEEIVQRVWVTWGRAQAHPALFKRAAHQRLARAAAELNGTMHDVDGNVRSPPVAQWDVVGRKGKRARSPARRPGGAGGSDPADAQGAPARPYNTRRNRTQGPWYASGVGSRAAAGAAGPT